MLFVLLQEVCLVRFSPETEEDEISYTLLYAYFSSRRRFGVVSNNLKQVKDMYLIPLGSTEKVPHQLVPFDGPGNLKCKTIFQFDSGFILVNLTCISCFLTLNLFLNLIGLEYNRANLLLGLIIRQRPKRDFLPVVATESVRVVPESKPITIPTKVTRTTEEDEKLFLSSLVPPLTKELDKPLEMTEDEPVAEFSEEPSATEESSSQEPQKPLRFLPGVLVGWGGELPPLPDFSDKPLPTGQDTPNIQRAPKEDAPTSHSKSPTATASRFVIKKKETKPVKSELEMLSPDDAPALNNSLGKDPAEVVHDAPVTLKDKPPDVSTDDFLASLSAAQSGTEAEKGESEGSSLLLSESQAASDHTDGSKPPLSGILKKSSAYSPGNEVKVMVQQKEKASLPDAVSPKPVPVMSSTRRELVLPFHQGYLQLSQARHKPEENATATQSFLSKTTEHGIAQPGAGSTLTPSLPQVQGPQDISNTELDSVTTPAMPEYNSAAPSNTFSTTDTDDSSSQASSGLQPQNPESLSEPSGQISSLAKDYKRLEERYNDPWERPRNSEDRDHHRRHGYHKDSHHGKKSRHHDRERHSHDDKHRERSRHHGHSEDRHGERRKEKHHSQDYGSHHKDRHRHRQDSENGRRSSKDSCS